MAKTSEQLARLNNILDMEILLNKEMTGNLAAR